MAIFQISSDCRCPFGTSKFVPEAKVFAPESEEVKTHAPTSFPLREGNADFSDDDDDDEEEGEGGDNENTTQLLDLSRRLVLLIGKL